MRYRVSAVIFPLALALPAAVFAHGGDGNVTHACVHRVAGNVRFVAAHENCRPPEVAVHLPLQAGAGAGGPRGVQLFESDGSFTVPAGVTSVLVELWGGGGAAGLGFGTAPGGGGGGGGYVRTVVAVTPGDSVPVTVGAGGVAQCGFSGSSGGDTAFGNLAMAGGGGGGTDFGLGGAGGIAASGGISYPGQPGTDATPVGAASSFGLSAQGTFAPPRGPGIATPGKGGASILLPAGVCPGATLQFARGQPGQLIVQW